MINYTEQIAAKLHQLKETGGYRYFLDVNKSAQHFPNFYFEDVTGVKRKAINWCSNDYLAMSVNEAVIGKLSFVAHRSGAGSGGTRNISGTTNYHRILENTLAKLHQKTASLLFGSAYLANLTALSTLGKILPELVFISDENNHASIIEGIKASGSQKLIFKHNDIIDLEKCLQSLPIDQPKIIVFESVYSMSGTIAPIVDIVLLAKKYQALTYIDEVHAVGLYGEKGGGFTELLHIQQGVDIINGTLAKGFGVLGGYIAGDKTIIDAIRSFGAGFIFTTSLPPAICAAANTSIELLQSNPSIGEQYHQSIQKFREVLIAHAIFFHPNQTHITIIPIGDEIICKKISDSLLFEYGIYIQPINYPTVKKGAACLRITLTAKHSHADMVYLATSLQEVLTNISVKQSVKNYKNVLA